MSVALNYNHLRHFWVVSVEGSLTRAARRLGLTHSTLSTQLKQLEAHFGKPLLVRKSRGVALTPFGEYVKSTCDEIFRVASQLEDNTRGGRAVPRPAVRVGIHASLPRTLIHRALRTVRLGPDAPPLAVTTGLVDDLVEDLAAGKLHVVLTDRPPPTSVHIEVYVHLVGETRIALFASDSLARRLRSGFPRSLSGAPFLLPAGGTALREHLVRWFAEENVRPRIVGEFDDLPLMKTFAAAGDGVMAVREPLVDEAQRIYGLHRVGAAHGIRDQIYALTPDKRVRHGDVERFVAECRRRLA